MVRVVCPTCDAAPCPTCNGSGFWDDAWSGIKKGAQAVYDTVAPIAKVGLQQFGGPLGQAAVGFANSQGWGKPPKRTRRGGVAASVKARNEVVKSVMHQRGVSLIEASQIVKRDGLWKK